MAIEEHIKFELIGALAEAKKIIQAVPAKYQPYGIVEGEDQVNTFLEVQIRTVLISKVEEEVKKRIGFYSIEQLFFILEKLHEKTETRRAEPAGPVAISPEVRSEPALESPGKQKSDKGSKKPVLKRV